MCGAIYLDNSNINLLEDSQYLNGFEQLSQGLCSYKDEVEAAIFPNNKHCIQLDKTVLKNISENN